MSDIKQMLEEYFSKRNASYGLAIRFSSDTSEAEDRVHDAVVRALETKSPFQGKSSFGSWFCRIVINQAKYNTRQQFRIRHGMVPLENASLQNEEEDLSFDWLRDNRPGPLDEYMKSEKDEKILEEIANLREADRDVVLLHYFMDLSAIEIAEMTGVSKTAVKSRLHRSLLKLRERFQELGVAA